MNTRLLKKLRMAVTIFALLLVSLVASVPAAKSSLASEVPETGILVLIECIEFNGASAISFSMTLNGDEDFFVESVTDEVHLFGGNGAVLLTAGSQLSVGTYLGFYSGPNGPVDITFTNGVSVGESVECTLEPYSQPTGTSNQPTCDNPLGTFVIGNGASATADAIFTVNGIGYTIAPGVSETIQFSAGQTAVVTSPGLPELTIVFIAPTGCSYPNLVTSVNDVVCGATGYVVKVMNDGDAVATNVIVGGVNQGDLAVGASVSPVITGFSNTTVSADGIEPITVTAPVNPGTCPVVVALKPTASYVGLADCQGLISGTLTITRDGVVGNFSVMVNGGILVTFVGDTYAVPPTTSLNILVFDPAGVAVPTTATSSVPSSLICNPVTTPTVPTVPTVPTTPTTTTVPTVPTTPTTTTVPTVPTTPTTTTVPTVPTTPTTTTVPTAPLPPVPPQVPPVMPPGNQALPETGAASMAIVFLASVLLVMGIGAVLGARRRSSVFS